MFQTLTFSNAHALQPSSFKPSVFPLAVLLNLFKHAIAVGHYTFSINNYNNTFPTFCLDAKGGAQKSRQAQMAPRFLSPMHSYTPFLLYHSLTSNCVARVPAYTTYSKAHTNDYTYRQTHLKRCIPLCFSCSKIIY